MIARSWKKYNKFIKYCMIGAMSASIDFFIFFLLSTHTPLHYLLINVISISCGITNSFFFNARLNFKVYDEYLKRFAKFYTVGLFGIIISNTLLFILYEQMALPIIFSKGITIFLVVFLQFFLNSKYSLAPSRV